MFLIVANILSFIGNSFFTLSSILKSKRKILAFQSVNFVLAIVSEIMQKAWSGFAQDSMNVIKSMILLFVNESRRRIIILVNVVCMAMAFIGGIVLNFYLSNNAWYGYPPVFSTLILSICMLLAFVMSLSEEESVFMIKVALIFNGLCWGTYGFFVQLYPIMIFNGITIILSAVEIVKILVKKSLPKDV